MKYKTFKTVLILSTVLLLSGCSGRKDTPQQMTEPELQTEVTERLTETATEETEGESSRPEETTPQKETTSAEETTAAMESGVESSAVPSAEETAGEEETVNLYQKNFDPYENMRSVLSDQTAFRYCGTTFRRLDGFEDETVTLSGFLELIETTDYVNTKADKSTWKFSCVDLDGDNIKECIIKTDLIYYSVLVFHYRMGHISMYVFPYRNAAVFYSNGIIEGSGSASSVSFCRMHFGSDMHALLEDVAGTTQLGWLVTDEICAWIPVDGVRTEVTEPEFEAWWNANREEFLGEPAPQYDFTPENINMYVTE